MDAPASNELGERVGRMFWNTSDIAAAIGFDPREPLGALLG